MLSQLIRLLDLLCVMLARYCLDQLWTPSSGCDLGDCGVPVEATGYSIAAGEAYNHIRVIGLELLGLLVGLLGSLDPSSSLFCSGGAERWIGG